MWDWSKGKRALELLFWAGRITARRRPGDFARVYDLTERMIPAEVLAPPDARPSTTPDASSSTSPARYHGVGTARRPRRLPPAEHAPSPGPLVAELVEEGTLIPVQVEGWNEPAYLHRDAHLPRRVRARALLVAVRLAWSGSGPAPSGCSTSTTASRSTPRRRSGCTATTSCRSCSATASSPGSTSRPTGRRRRCCVQGAFAEPWAEPAEVAPPLHEELERMAEWLELDSVTIVRKGDLSPALRAAAGTPPRSRTG